MEPNYTTRILSYAIQTCGFYPLRPMQICLFDIQLTSVRSTMLNMNQFYKLDNETDMECLAKAITDSLENHDAFHCRFIFHPDTDDLCQRFDGEIIPVEVERLSDEEFESRKETLDTPYNLINSPLYNIHLIETPTAKYLYVNFHHTIFDAISAYMILFREVDQRYQGKPPKRAAPKYSDLIIEELLISPDELARGNAYWRNIAKKFDAKKHMPPPDVENCPDPQDNIVKYDLKNVTKNFFDEKHRNENNFFLAATMLTIAKITGAKDSVMAWIHSGRTSMHEYRIIGLMIQHFLIAMDFDDNMTVSDFLKSLENQINIGMRYRRSLEVVYTEGLLDECATFLFQKGFISEHNHNVSFGGKPAEILELPATDGEFSAENELDFEFHADESGGYSVEFEYVTSRYSDAAMQRLAESIDETILLLQDDNATLAQIIG